MNDSFWENWLLLLNSNSKPEIIKEPTCEVIDIANEEMKKIDSTEIDSHFNNIFVEEVTQNLIDLIDREKWTDNDIQYYLKTLNDDDILDLRVSEKSLYIKTTKGIIPVTLSRIMKIDEEAIEKVPINGKYNFYVVDCRRWATPIYEEALPSYDPEDLVDILMDIGGDCIGEDLLTVNNLFDLVKRALNENWEEMPDDIHITVEVEDKVVAIALDQFVLDAKKVLSDALFLNPKIFIEVSTPIGTVLLIDTRRWYLEPNFGGEEWYR